MIVVVVILVITAHTSPSFTLAYLQILLLPVLDYFTQPTSSLHKAPGLGWGRDQLSMGITEHTFEAIIVFLADLPVSSVSPSQAPVSDGVRV